MSTRKEFIKSAGLLSAGLMTGISSLSDPIQASSGQRPNILFALADDMGWPNASIYPQSDEVINTPNFDRVAQRGILFSRAYTPDPSCAPSRAAILTGQYPHQLGDAANLWGKFPKEFPVYTSLLADHGYNVGFQTKGWAPGNYEAGGWTHNPAGRRYNNFRDFFKRVSDDEPFCFWYGSHHPHRPYKKGQGVSHGLDPAKVNVPPYLPDKMVARKDISDYYYAVEKYDRQVGQVLNLLEKMGRLDNTIVVMTGDNGWPFPRAKANLYDCGTHIPLAIAWGDNISGDQINNDFVSFVDLAPTFLQAVGLPVPKQMSGHSLLPLLLGNTSKYKSRNNIFLERERHAYCRKEDVGYPMRAIRSSEFLYVWNMRPHRWPAGSPTPKVGEEGRPFGDVDSSPTKHFIMDKQKHMPIHPEKAGRQEYQYFKLAMGKRPGEELYDLREDPHELHNVVKESGYQKTLLKYRKMLKSWMRKTDDPRITGHAQFDNMPYYGPAPWRNDLKIKGHGSSFGAPTKIKKY